MSEKILGGVETDVVANAELPAKIGIWPKVKAFLFQEIKVELTSTQQKLEDEINDFLHQDITWERVRNFLFQKVSFK